jgi:hypothetical protein
MPAPASWRTGGPSPGWPATQIMIQMQFKRLVAPQFAGPPLATIQAQVGADGEAPGRPQIARAVTPGPAVWPWS